MKVGKSQKSKVYHCTVQGVYVYDSFLNRFMLELSKPASTSEVDDVDVDFDVDVDLNVNIDVKIDIDVNTSTSTSTAVRRSSNLQR